jgi:hypothetical protein
MRQTMNDLIDNEFEEQKEQKERQEELVLDAEDGDEAGEDVDEGQDDDIFVTIGDEPAPEREKAAPQWVRDLRKENREDKRRIRELEEKLAKPAHVEAAIVIGKKPSLADDDIDYDEDKFESALTAWHDRKRKADDQELQARKAGEESESAWKERLGAYEEAKSGLKVKDYEDAEDVARSSLNVTQQGIIIQGAENPALVIYALGKNPKKAKELAGITDHVKFAFAIAKLEGQLKMTSRKAPPAPERTVTGSGKVSGAVDNTLERMRAEAEKTGDYSKVTAYKRQQRDKGR